MLRLVIRDAIAPIMTSQYWNHQSWWICHVLESVPAVFLIIKMRTRNWNILPNTMIMSRTELYQTWKKKMKTGLKKSGLIIYSSYISKHVIFYLRARTISCRQAPMLMRAYQVAIYDQCRKLACKRPTVHLPSDPNDRDLLATTW